VSVFVVLTFIKVIPLWLTVLVIARDIAILLAVGVSYAMGQQVKFKPIWISKINTALQVALIGLVLLLRALDKYDPAVINLACYVVAATTIASWLQYFVMWLRFTMAKPHNSA
jgi:cardiolipin synthase (CMP-forming)